ncbi:MAG: tetratricopeptide repeat protein [Pirellulales bacterium]
MAARRSKRARAANGPAGGAALVAASPADGSLLAAWSRLSPRFRSGLLAAALVAITANAYAPVFECGYVWDDDSYVTRNPTLLTADGLRQIWLEVGATPQYYPLVFTSFWIEYQLFGLNPAVSHTVNLLLHCGAALLVWRVLSFLGASGPVAWIAALVFAVHPVHVESVAWITERKNVLSGVCYLGALWAYLEFDRRARVPREGEPAARRWACYALALLLFVAALLSKTVTATLPVAILILLWYRWGRLSWRDAARVAPLLAVGIALGAVTVWLERQHVGAVGQDWDLSPLGRVLLAGRAAWFYAAKLVWPHPIVFVYPRWQIDTAAVWQYLFPAAAVGLVVLLWLLRGTIGRGPLAAILFFAVTLGPALGFVNVYPMRYSYVADHFQYLASLGIIALLVSAAWQLWQRAASGGRTVIVAVGIAWVATLAVLTWEQVHDYADLESLWTNTLAKNPDAWIAAHNLGVMQLERRAYPQAERYFRQVIASHPNDARALNNLGLLQIYKRDLPGAIARFEEAIRADPDFAGSRVNLARIRLVQGDVPQAAEHFRHALAVDPSQAMSQQGLAMDILDAADQETAKRLAQEMLKALDTGKFPLETANHARLQRYARGELNPSPKHPGGALPQPDPAPQRKAAAAVD